MSEVNKCPKCGGTMAKGRGLGSWGGVTFAKKDDWFGDKIMAYYCINCGYIELFKEMKEKKERPAYLR